MYSFIVLSVSLKALFTILFLVIRRKKAAESKQVTIILGDPGLLDTVKKSSVFYEHDLDMVSSFLE